MNSMFTDWKSQYYKDVKSPQIGFVELDKLILKYLWANTNGPFITRVLFQNEKQKMTGFPLPNSHIYYKAIFIIL